MLAKSYAQDKWNLPLWQWRLKSQTQPEPHDLAFINLTPDDDHVVRRQLLSDFSGTEFHFALALASLAHRHGGDRWEVLRPAPNEIVVGNRRVPSPARRRMKQS